VREPLSILKTGTETSRVIQVSGELDLATAPKLDAVLEDLDGVHLVFLELWDLSFIDSTGFRTIVAAHQRLEDRGGRLVLHGLSPFAEGAVKVLGLDRVLHLES